MQPAFFSKLDKLTKMKKTIAALLFISSLSTFAKAKREFKYNYKNLNTLAAYLCHINTPSKAKGKIQHKTEIDINQTGPSLNNRVITITGLCGIQNNSLDESLDLSLDIDLNSGKDITGTIGLNNILVDFKKKRIAVTNMMDGQRRVYSLSNILWAQSNSNFMVSKRNTISSQSKSLKISESTSDIRISSRNLKTQIKNAWSYEATAVTYLN